MAKSWQEKYDNGKPPHVSILEKPFGAVPRGGRLFIASPALVDDAVRAVRRGRTQSIVALREKLAAANNADATCQLTTSIFLRIVAERAMEHVADGVALSRVTPFWRVIDPESELAKKLSCGPAFIRAQRKREQTTA